MPERARIIGRILSLGYPLPGPLVDNYSFLGAPAFFDYDAMVVDPRSLSELIQGVIAGSLEAETFGGTRIRCEPADATDAALRDVLMQRREETRTLLERGGVIVVFTHPPVAHTIGGPGRLDDYFWLPENVATMCRPPALAASGGTQAHVVDFRHPLAAFVHGQLANVAYRAYFAHGAVPASNVFARSEGGAAIGVELPAKHGRVIMLPALKTTPASDARYTASDALQAGIRQALGVMAQGREPQWASSFALPGLDERATALAEARRALGRSQEALDDAERAHEELARFRRLLWQEGALGLQDVVLDALRLIGFETYAQDPNALELRYGDASVLLEIAASEHPIDLAAHYRLRERIEDAISRRGAAPRGLLIVNGERLSPPAERADDVSGALRLAAETMRYGIATTASLFAAVASQMSGDDAAVSAYRCRLLRDEGVIA